MDQSFQSDYMVATDDKSLSSNLSGSNTNTGDLQKSTFSLGDFSQDGLVDAKYLEEAGPRLFNKAQDLLKSKME